MILKTAKIRTEALHKSVLPFAMAHAMSHQTGNNVTGSGSCIHSILYF